MSSIDVTFAQKEAFNELVVHPLQSFEWGEFRQKTGIKVIRKLFGKQAIQLTIHPIPYTPWNIGYVPKGIIPKDEMLSELVKIAKDQNCVFIQLEPNIEKFQISNLNPDSIGIKYPISNNCQLASSIHPLFTKYTFILDLTKSEEELLKAMHPKTRYNIKVAQKHGVYVKEDNSDKAFEEYLALTFETTKRQGFYAHTEKYHRLMWETFRIQNSEFRIQNVYNELTAHLLTANYQPKTINQKPITLVSWILFVFHDTLYYPYGASSAQHRDVMASNLMMWEVIRFGKKLGLKKFDLWGSLGPNPNPKDPWFGFHKFKQGYGAKHVEYVGSFDLIIQPLQYKFYVVADKLRWLYLRAKAAMR